MLNASPSDLVEHSSASPPDHFAAPFAAALLDAAAPIPSGLSSFNGAGLQRRFAVYRNNVLHGLSQALAQGFPVLRHVVGDEFFFAMARLYVSANPPRSAVLAFYGEGLADWLQSSFAPAACLPYLPCLARLEHARTCSYHAADVPVLQARDLAAAFGGAADLQEQRLTLHPSVHFFSSPWAVLSLWAAHQAEDDSALRSLDIAQPEAGMLLRHQDEVLVFPLPLAAVRFVQALLHALPLGEAAAMAMQGAHGEGFDLAQTLALLIQHGAITKVSAPQTRG